MVEIVVKGPGKNALGTARMTEVSAAFEAAGGAPVLLRGDGDAFSAGLDLAEVGSLGPAEMTAFLRRLEQLLAQVWSYPGPVVAVVNGHAIAGGCLLALVADWRVCVDAPKARLGLNEVGLGLAFPPSILRLVRARLPTQALEEVLLGAGLHAPADALRLGLVDALAADPLAVGRARLAALAQHPADAYARAKRDLRAGVLEVTDAERQRFLDEVVPAWTSDALKARIAGFLKR